ncbi:MAG: hypothetical protein U0547_06035 [Dehalococcoidia bacterium]
MASPGATVMLPGCGAVGADAFVSVTFESCVPAPMRIANSRLVSMTPSPAVVGRVSRRRRQGSSSSNTGTLRPGSKDISCRLRSARIVDDGARVSGGRGTSSGKLPVATVMLPMAEVANSVMGTSSAIWSSP